MRVPRPGGSTATTSTAPLNSCAQARKIQGHRPRRENRIYGLWHRDLAAVRSTIFRHLVQFTGRASNSRQNFRSASVVSLPSCGIFSIVPASG